MRRVPNADDGDDARRPAVDQTAARPSGALTLADIFGSAPTEPDTAPRRESRNDDLAAIFGDAARDATTSAGVDSAPGWDRESLAALFGTRESGAPAAPRREPARAPVKPPATSVPTERTALTEPASLSEPPARRAPAASTIRTEPASPSGPAVAEPDAFVDLFQRRQAPAPARAAEPTSLTEPAAPPLSAELPAPARAAEPAAPAPTAVLAPTPTLAEALQLPPDDPPFPVPTADAPHEPRHARPRSVWSARRLWAVAASVVLVLALGVGAIIVAQTLAENARIADATAQLDAAVAAVDRAESDLEAALAAYNETVETALAAAVSAEPALAAVEGMAPPEPVAAARTARTDLVAALDSRATPAQPEPYTNPDAASLDGPTAMAAATQAAQDHVDTLTDTTAETDAAHTAIQVKLDALTQAQVALGAALPTTAAAIVAENPRAEQPFRDAVVAAAAAVGAAQASGGSGDAELLAYAGTVTALREDQRRAEEEAEEEAERPVVPQPEPQQPQPQPEPQPQPPQPQPQPTEDPAPAPPPPEENPDAGADSGTP